MKLELRLHVACLVVELNITLCLAEQNNLNIIISTELGLTVIMMAVGLIYRRGKERFFLNIFISLGNVTFNNQTSTRFFYFRFPLSDEFWRHCVLSGGNV